MITVDIQSLVEIDVINTPIYFWSITLHGPSLHMPVGDICGVDVCYFLPPSGMSVGIIWVCVCAIYDILFTNAHICRIQHSGRILCGYDSAISVLKSKIKTCSVIGCCSFLLNIANA